MAEVKGKLVSCCRCSNAIFLKLLGREALDGGYSSYDKYEDLPKEWMYETQFGHLCPKCAKEFQIFCRDFFPGNIAPAWRNALDWVEVEFETDSNSMHIYNNATEILRKAGVV